ncbi:MAG: NBR1-Ig-like domain-containing protein [Chloroflexi bacterium]|nr:NBR1-Ig-like domain-containing protein [Chloroflexota bacterium]
MLTFNKIGFHSGRGRNTKAMLAYFKRLDEAGIPFVMAVEDDVALCQLLLRYRNAPHVVSLRFSETAVPDYSLDPDMAAEKTWLALQKLLPANLDKSRVWLEPIRQPEPLQSNWLGQYATHMGQTAVAEGYKLALFGWAAGEPAADLWQTAGMVSYLELCEKHPTQLAIALHELSRDAKEIWREKGEHLGRFAYLFATCDRLGIARPTVLITEWGWTHEALPKSEVALEQIREANNLYAPHPQILGAALYSLTGGEVGAAVRKLVEPVTEFALNCLLEVEAEAPEPPATPFAPVTGMGELLEPALELDTGDLTALAPEEVRLGTLSAAAVAAQYNATFLADVTIPDDTAIPLGGSFTKTWRIRNSGRTAWDNRIKLVFVGGDPLGDQMAIDVPATQPGAAVTISLILRAPQQAGTVYTDWRLHDPNGRPFGDILYTRINATPPVPVGVDEAVFLADVNIPDDTIVEGGKRFTKTWRIRNTGTRPWGAGYQLVFTGGAGMAPTQSVPLPATAVGQTADVSVEMTAPAVAGTYQTNWRPQNPQGENFGHNVYVRIQVPTSKQQGRIAPISQRDPRWINNRLGTMHSDTTIGKWGCLMTCLSMVSTASGRTLTPVELNDRMLVARLFLDHKVTPWNTLSQLFSEFIFDGRRESRNTPNLTDLIDGSLRAGNPVPVQVDYTPLTPYVESDQHWVLIVGREGNDYRINDPLLFPSEEGSLRQLYGRPNQSLTQAIVAALFYRTTTAQPALPVVVGGVLSAAGAGTAAATSLQAGMNVNPLAPFGNPHESGELKGMEWVRFPYVVAGQPDPRQRSLTASFAFYDPILKNYSKQGTGAVVVLNHETVWGHAPWQTGGDWAAYGRQLAEAARQIAAHYASYGAKMAYEIWAKQDVEGQSMAIPAAHYGAMLKEVSAAIRKSAPQAKVILGGLGSGPQKGVAYVQAVQQAAGGTLPVDALGLHPYGRWGTKAPFDWGKTHGTLGEAFGLYTAAFPTLPLWITEMGVPNGQPLGREHDAEIAAYVRDVYQHVANRHTRQVPVVIWYAWGDVQNNAGVVQVGGRPKTAIYEAVKTICAKQW